MTSANEEPNNEEWELNNLQESGQTDNNNDNQAGLQIPGRAINPPSGIPVSGYSNKPLSLEARLPNTNCIRKFKKNEFEYQKVNLVLEIEIPSSYSDLDKLTQLLSQNNIPVDSYVIKKDGWTFNTRWEYKGRDSLRGSYSMQFNYPGEAGNKIHGTLKTGFYGCDKDMAAGILDSLKGFLDSHEKPKA
jgi:hypothetical protein